MLPFLAAGAFLAFVGWLVRPRFLPGDADTQGTVVEILENRDGAVAVIEFRDTDGTAYRFEPSMTVDLGNRVTVGQAVTVRYSLADPQRTCRRTDGPEGRLHLVLAALGAAVALSGLTGFWD